MLVLAAIQDRWGARRANRLLRRYQPWRKLEHLGLQPRGSDAATLELALALNNEAWRARQRRG